MYVRNKKKRRGRQIGGAMVLCESCLRKVFCGNETTMHYCTAYTPKISFDDNEMEMEEKMRKILSLTVKGFSANDERIDGTLEINVIFNDGKSMTYKTTGKATLYEIVDAISREATGA